MVCTSMDVDICNVSIHGLANNGYRTANCLPSALYHAIPNRFPFPSRLPNRPLTLEDDIQRLHLRESMALAALSKMSSFHTQAPTREQEAKHAISDGPDQGQIKTLDSPFPNRSFRLQSWLLH
jgi:hypothetical protein